MAWGYFVIPAIGLILSFNVSTAREDITDWYIKGFASQISVNKDSSLEITERITADCGNLPGKHGIFRILPEKIKVTDGSVIDTPVEIISITDFSGQPIKYSQQRNYIDDTVTWKIGDAGKTVRGVNEYEIRYRVGNAIRAGADFDELYWNLNGNFWDIETDSFEAKIVFPEGITEKNSQVDYYTGPSGSKDKSLARFSWVAPDVLEFESTRPLGIREGITASVIFPKNIVEPYVPGFLDEYGRYLWFLPPFVIFLICLWLWMKYGKDPKMDKTVIAEYDVPGHMSPIEIGILEHNGTFKNELITAEIINLAVNGLITVRETDEKFLFLHSKDYEFTRIKNSEAEICLTAPQKLILDQVFSKGDVIKLSSLKTEFHKALSEIKKEGQGLLTKKGYIVPSSLKLQVAFIVAGIIMLISTFFIGSFWPYLAAAMFFSGLVIFIFGFVMPKRTVAGAELNWQVRGFRLFMETVDKHRAEFYERENIFEKFLPYAIVFGITGLWIKKMKDLYGEEYFRSHTPIWYAGSMNSFSVDGFSSAIDSLSSSIAASTSSPSGSGGSGGSGGGGGGGGGGGW